MPIGTETQEKISAAAVEAYKLVQADMESLKEQVRKVADKLDRHLKAERRARGAYNSTYDASVKEEK